MILHDLGAAFAAAAGADEVFICGGGMVFHETVSLADRIYLSIIHRKYEGDVFFPDIPGDFVEVRREEVENTPPYSFVIYERKTVRP